MRLQPKAALGGRSGDVGKVMIVCLTDGRANVSIKKSTGDPEAMAPDAPKIPQAQLKEEVLDMAGKARQQC